MLVKVVIQSKELSKGELQHLLQAIRDCEQKSFPDKEIHILLLTPELPAAEASEILTSIRPAFKYGPVCLFSQKKEGNNASH